jgi:hypothetical protein
VLLGVLLSTGFTSGAAHFEQSGSQVSQDPVVPHESHLQPNTVSTPAIPTITYTIDSTQTIEPKARFTRFKLKFAIMPIPTRPQFTAPIINIILEIDQVPQPIFSLHIINQSYKLLIRPIYIIPQYYTHDTNNLYDIITAWKKIKKKTKYQHLWL